jgi:putative ABC transport system permease protein
VALGTVVALLLGRVLAALLFEVRPADPLTLSGVALFFGTVALLACAVPAWRAAGVDLMEALRRE